MGRTKPVSRGFRGFKMLIDDILTISREDLDKEVNVLWNRMKEFNPDANIVPYFAAIEILNRQLFGQRTEPKT